jgi:hypothetical protein
MSDASDDANRWTWVTPDGKTVSGAKGELMLALRGERLPVTTLIWRPGWAEWLPASRVTELRSVLPRGAAEPAQAPKLAGAPAAGTPTAPVAQQKHPAESPPQASQPPPAPVRGASGTSRPPPAPVRNKGPATSQPPPAPVRAKVERRPLEIPGLRAPTAAGPIPAAHGLPTRPRGVSILGPPREVMTNSALSRGPLPTLGGEEAIDPRTTTLRPPGAVPPPPRAMGPAPGARSEEELPTQRKVPSMLGVLTPSGGPTSEVSAPTELRPGIVLPHSAEAPATVPTSPHGVVTAQGLGPAPGVAATAAGTPTSAGATAARDILADLEATLGSTPFESERSHAVAPPSTTLESTGPSAPPEAASDGAAPDTLPGDKSVALPIPRSVALALTVAIAGTLVLVTGALVFSSHGRPTSKAPDARASSASAAAEAAPGCRLLSPAARLSITTERSVQPVLAELERAERVAIGFAPAPKTAGGAAIRLDTLDAVRSPDQAGDAPVRSSVPLIKNGQIELSVDRAGGELVGARTLPDGSTLGFAGADLVRRSGDKRTVLVAGAGSDKTTDPRVAKGRAGTLVTFRRGGLSGQVLYTWLSPEGAGNGTLTPVIVPDVKFSGTPDAAANAKGGVLAFASRASESAEWRVELVSVEPSGKPSARLFVTPAGGSGGGNIAPAVTALGDDGWVLQWTEGAAGAYEVRLQRLNALLEPVGEARLVSPKGANAGQGALLATGSRVLSVFIQTTAGHDELWGATFECL